MLINRPHYSAQPLINEPSKFFQRPLNLLLVCAGFH